MLAFIRDGDTVIVDSMDRLARNLDARGGRRRLTAGKCFSWSLGIFVYTLALMAKTNTEARKTSQSAGRTKTPARKTSAARSTVTKAAARKVPAARMAATPRAAARKTPPRAVRVPDRLWEQAKEAAEQRGENVSQVIKRALLRYVRDTERRQAALERFDRVRGSIPPGQRLPEDEALRLAGEEKAAMRAERDQAQAG